MFLLRAVFRPSTSVDISDQFNVVFISNRAAHSRTNYSRSNHTSDNTSSSVEHVDLLNLVLNQKLTVSLVCFIIVTFSIHLS